MNPLVAMLVSSLAVVPRVVEKDGVQVEVLIQSQHYVWRVRNTEADPIVGFELHPWNCYTHTGPPGWKIELSEDEQTMHARTEDPHLAIGTGREGDFNATVTSNGATLGVIPMKLTTTEGETIELDVWGPVAMPHRAVLTAALTLCGVAFLHARIVHRRRKAT